MLSIILKNNSQRTWNKLFSLKIGRLGERFTKKLITFNIECFLKNEISQLLEAAADFWNCP